MANSTRQPAPKWNVTRFTESKRVRMKIRIVTLGIRQVQIARDLEIDATRLSKLLNGWVKPKPDEIVRLDSYLTKHESDRVGNE